jgi:hypothetical protein
VRSGSAGRRSVAASSFRLLIPVSRVCIHAGAETRAAREVNRFGKTMLLAFLAPILHHPVTSSQCLFGL